MSQGTISSPMAVTRMFRVLCTALVIMCWCGRLRASEFLVLDEVTASGDASRLIFVLCHRARSGYLYNGYSEVVCGKVINRCTRYAIYADTGQGLKPIFGGVGEANFNVYFCGPNKTGDNKYMYFAGSEIRRALDGVSIEYNTFKIQLRVIVLDEKGRPQISHGQPATLPTGVLHMEKRDSKYYIKGFEACAETGDKVFEECDYEVF